MLWTLIACIVWLVAAAVYLLSSSSRSKVKAVSLAMAATFPSVLIFQAVAGILDVLILLFCRLFWKALEPGAAVVAQSALVNVVSYAGVLFVIVFTLGMSVWVVCGLGVGQRAMHQRCHQ
jgi:hypothetical protein